MKVKTNDKVKFADCAKHLKSYDAGAVSVVLKVWDDYGLCSVEWTRQDGSKFNTTNIGTKNLELATDEPEEQVTLQPGDWCGDELTEEQYSKVFDCFVAAGAEVGQGKDFEWLHEGARTIAWSKEEGQISDDIWHPYIKGLDRGVNSLYTRQLTYSQIVNATNAKPKPTASEAIKSLGEAMGSVASTEPEPQQTLDSAVQELTEVNQQLAELSAKREQLIKFIEDGVSGAGLSVTASDVQPQPEKLDITDWRDLKAGDVIEILKVSEDDFGHFSQGNHYTVDEIDQDDMNMPICVVEDDKNDYRWLEPGTTWKFISRPTC